MNIFSIAHPYLLILLIIPVILGLWEFGHKVSPIVMPFDHAHRYRGNWLKWFVNTANLIPVFLLALAIIFICGPRKTAPPKTKREMTNIQICLDASASMKAKMGDGNRYDAAIKAVKKFTKYRKGDSFGLTIYGTEFLHLIPVTQDISAIDGITKFFKPRSFGKWFGGTNTGKALEGCIDQLSRQKEGDRMVILITDGMSSDLRGGNARVVAQQLVEANIVVYIICVKTNPNAENFTIAGLTGGDVFQADDPEMLNEVFQEIDKMQKVKLKHLKASTIDFFQPFALAGLILLACQICAMFGLRYNPW